MTTLIIARKADGRLTGRCDARCYNAKHPRCTCICGGANHGVGRKQATENLGKQELWAHYDHAGILLTMRPAQLTLFEEVK
jgi:hypothetical protein